MNFIKYSVLFFLVIVFSNNLNADKISNLFILGDSLTEGYGVAQLSAFPALIQKKFEKNNLPWKVTSSGSSGSTSASGPSRMKWITNPKNKERPDLVLLLLGSNDGLRGLKPSDTEKYLNETIAVAKKQNIDVIIGQLYMPPNYGKEYTEKFALAFVNVAKKQKVPLLSFLLEGVAGSKELNLADGIHPNEKGHLIVSENIFKSLQKYLQKK